MTAQNEPARKKVVVLDTSALVAGLDPFSLNELQYTVPTVVQEIGEKSVASFRLKTASENGRVTIEEPPQESMANAEMLASEVGDTHFLSKADKQVLALSLDLKKRGCLPIIVTDDYSIQNVAKQAGIDFTSLATFGIRKRLHWLRYCPACHKTYPANYRSSTCEVCGTELKRKPVRATNTEGQTT